MTKNDNLAVISGLILVLAVLASLTTLLVLGVIQFDQAGIFLAVVAVPLAALAGSPLFSAALKASSPDQTAQLHATLNQSIQALAQAAQPAPVQVQTPAPAATSSGNVGASTSAVVNPVLPITNTPGPVNWLAVPSDPQDTFPHAAVAVRALAPNAPASS